MSDETRKPTYDIGYRFVYMNESYEVAYIRAARNTPDGSDYIAVNMDTGRVNAFTADMMTEAWTIAFEVARLIAQANALHGDRRVVALTEAEMTVLLVALGHAHDRMCSGKDTSTFKALYDKLSAKGE